MTKERPIIFRGDMVREVLDGTKTQTRRVVKPQPTPNTVGYSWFISTDRKRNGTFIPRDANGVQRIHHEHETGPPVRCPYGSPEDRLWVRETFCDDMSWDHTATIEDRLSHTYYRATGDENYDSSDVPIKWQPSIYMPRWASRITLEVTEVRVERLHAISTDAIIAEGIDVPDVDYSVPDHPGRLDDERDAFARRKFRTLWDAINLKRGFGWDTNPWLWVVSFKRLPQEATRCAS